MLKPMSFRVLSAWRFTSSSTRKLICAIFVTPFCIFIIQHFKSFYMHFYIHLLCDKTEFIVF